MVKEEFKDIELHDGGGLNFMVTRDTQKSRKIDIYGYRGIFFLTFGFKDVMSGAPPATAATMMTANTSASLSKGVYRCMRTKNDCTMSPPFFQLSGSMVYLCC